MTPQPPQKRDPVAEFAAMAARANARPWRLKKPPPDRSFDDFRQIVRRYAPSALLPVLARFTLSIGEPPFSDGALALAPPWAIALIARESVLSGNEHRSHHVTGESLRTLINAHNGIREMGPVDELSDEERSSALLDVMIRVAYEQFPYQESLFEEVSRSHALMVEGAGEIPVDVLDDGAWVRLLGAPLGNVVGATFFLQVAADNNGGWFDDSVLDRRDLAEIFEHWSPDDIRRRADQLSSTFDEFKAAYQAVKHPPRGFERWAYNPLVKRPFLRMPDGRLLAPQPRLIMRTVSPGGLYYDGMGMFGQAFGRDLGHLTGHYVGKQLRSIEPQARVETEFKYRCGRDHLDSTDWFLVLPSVLVLIEVKSARFGLLERAALGDYRHKMKGLLDKAARQVARSAEAISAGVPEFEHLPSDRPQVGVIVTGEPLYMTNTHWARDILAESALPTLTASLRDIESLCTLPLEEIDRRFLAIVSEPDSSAWTLFPPNAPPMEPRKNVVLERAWDSYPWPVGLDEED